MKKFILLLAILGCINANAQTAYERANILDNVYVGVHGGVSTPMDLNSVTPLNALGGITIGKMWSPAFGTEVEGDAWFGDNHFMNGRTFVKASYVGVNNVLNLTNLFLSTPQKFELSAVTGMGWIHAYNNNPLNTDHDNLGAKTGAKLAWNVSDKVQLFAEPAVYWNLSYGDKIQFNKNHAQLALQVGLVYKFKTSNGTHDFKAYNVGEMKEMLVRLRAENEALEKRKPTVIERTIEKEVLIDKTSVVQFAKNSDVLTVDAMEVLNKVKKGSSVDIIAYASPEGKADYNQELSAKRAKVVAEYLKNRGVKVSSILGKGAATEASNRIAIITIK